MDILAIIKKHLTEGAADDSAVAAMEKEIKQAIGKAFVTNEQYSIKTKLVAELEGQVSELQAKASDYDALKQSLEVEKKAHQATKDTYAAEKNAAEISAAVRKQLEADGANPKAVDLLLKAVDLTAVKLKDGAIENWKDIAEPIKTRYADFFGTVEQQGADVGNPPQNNGTLNPFSKDHFDLQAQTALFRSNPKLAREMAGAAGIKLLD